MDVCSKRKSKEEKFSIRMRSLNVLYVVCI